MSALILSRKLSILLWDELQEFPEQSRYGTVLLDTHQLSDVKTSDLTNQWLCESAPVVFQTFWELPSTPPTTLKAKIVLGIYLQEPGVLQMVGFTRKNNNDDWSSLEITLGE